MSGTFTVLRASDSRERAVWHRLWESWPHREVWADPAYAELFLGPGEEVVCASLGCADGGILFPLILRRIPAEIADGGTLFDLTGPYGYGGPFCWGSAEHHQEGFWEDLGRWCLERGVVAVFSRLGVFPEQLTEGIPGAVTVGENVVRDLTGDLESIWMDYEHKVRKNVKRARRDGVTVVVDDTGSRLDEFLEIYSSTMDRRSAGGFYRFGKSWFERARAVLGEQCVFFHALLEGRMVSTELVLVSRNNVYSFLGGTLVAAFASRPNDLLKHEIIVWARERGKACYVLGGGFLSGDDRGRDGVFRYKRSFAPHGIVPFRVMRWVVDPDRYGELIESRVRREREQGRDWEPPGAFFPAYRG